MDSIISMEELLNIHHEPKTRLKLYQACLEEFEQFKYCDPYLVQIREEISQLKKVIEGVTDTHSETNYDLDTPELAE